VLGREVVEAQQFLGVVGDLGHGLGPLGAVVAREHLDRTNSVVPVGGVADLGQGLTRPGVHRGGQAAEHVGELVDPVALLAGGWEHVAEGRPQAQRAVPDRDHRRPHPAAPQIPQDLRPAVGGLPLAIGHRDQLLGAVGAHAHDHQAAQASLLQPHPEVHAVRPDVHIVTVGQVALAEHLVVGLPGGQQSAYGSG
jgi:hypothetical protein